MKEARPFNTTAPLCVMALPTQEMLGSPAIRPTMRGAVISSAMIIVMITIAGPVIWPGHVNRRCRIIRWRPIIRRRRGHHDGRRTSFDGCRAIHHRRRRWTRIDDHSGSAHDDRRRRREWESDRDRNSRPRRHRCCQSQPGDCQSKEHFIFHT
jgi:hypothetical protein